MPCLSSLTTLILTRRCAGPLPPPQFRQTCVCANRFCAGRGVRAICRQVGRSGATAPGGQWFPGWGAAGTADRPGLPLKVEAQIDDAISKGAGLPAAANGWATRAFSFEPTVLLDATPEMLIARDETFGPVAPLFSFKKDSEAVTLANATPYGLPRISFTVGTSAASGEPPRRWNTAW